MYTERTTLITEIEATGYIQLKPEMYIECYIALTAYCLSDLTIYKKRIVYYEVILLE